MCKGPGLLRSLICPNRGEWKRYDGGVVRVGSCSRSLDAGHQDVWGTQGLLKEPPGVRRWLA